MPTYAVVAGIIEGNFRRRHSDHGPTVRSRDDREPDRIGRLGRRWHGLIPIGIDPPASEPKGRVSIRVLSNLTADAARL